MKTEKEHLLDIYSHYTSWIVSTKGFLEDNPTRKGISEETRERLKKHYEENLADYQEKRELIESLMEGVAV